MAASTPRLDCLLVAADVAHARGDVGTLAHVQGTPS